MLLDKWSESVVVNIKDEKETEMEDDQNWVGGNGEWLVLLSQDGSTWTLKNCYRSKRLAVPSLKGVGITAFNSGWPPPISEFAYRFNMAELDLVKVQLPHRPREGAWKNWEYDLLAVFDKAITFIRCPEDKEWTVLRDDFLRPEKYVDAVFTYGYSSYRPQHIYAATEPSGDVRVWEPSIWGESWCHIACKIPFKILLTDC